MCGDEAEGEREQVGVERGVVGADAIAIDAFVREEELLVEGGEGFAVALFVGGGVGFVSGGAGDVRHAFEGGEVEGVDDGVDGGELVAVALAGGPVDDVVAFDLLAVAADEAVFTGAV